MRLRAGRSARAPGAAVYSDAVLPGRRTPWRSAAWCAVDLELTGLDPARDEIISFGAVPVRDGRLQVGRAVTGLVRPEVELGEDSIPIHGIRAVDLAEAPSLAEALETLLPAIAGAVLVAHTAAVERVFLGNALRSVGLRLRGSIADTETLGALWLREHDHSVGERIGLGELARELGVPAERPHDALGDALTTAQVFIALASHLDARHTETVGSLARAGRRLESLRLFHDR